MDWLAEILSKGPEEGGKIQSQARECGFSEATLRTAKRKLGIRVVKYGFSSDGHWLWWLPGAAGLETMEDLERFAAGNVKEDGSRLVRRGSPSDRRGSPTDRRGSPDRAEDANEPEEEIWTPVMYRASDRTPRRTNQVVPRLQGANSGARPD